MLAHKWRMAITSMTNKKWSEKKFVGEWAKTLQTFLKNEQEPVPEGWYRPECVLGKMGFMSVNSGQRVAMLGKMVQKGYLEKRYFRVLDSSGRRLSHLLHYRLKNNHKKSL